MDSRKSTQERPSTQGITVEGLNISDTDEVEHPEDPENPRRPVYIEWDWS